VTKLTEVRLTKPVMFENEYRFDKSTLISKFEKISNNPNFIKGAKPLLSGNGSGTSYNMSKDPIDWQPHLWIELTDFVTWIKEQATEIFKIWKFEYTNPIIDNSWVNRHQKDGSTGSHYHHFCDLVVTAYVQAPIQSGNLIVTDPLEYHWLGFRSYINADISHGNRILSKDNKVLFFAPFLRHETEINQTNEDRWVMSFNIKTGPK